MKLGPNIDLTMGRVRIAKAAAVAQFGHKALAMEGGVSEVGMGKEPDGGVGERGKEEKGEGGGNFDHIYCIGSQCALPKRNVPSPTPPVVTTSKKGGIG